MLELSCHRKFSWVIPLSLAGLAVLLVGSVHQKETNLIPEEPEIRSSNRRISVDLIAYTVADGRSQFRSEAGSEPPVLRVWPGDKLDIAYTNELAGKSKEQCA